MDKEEKVPFLCGGIVFFLIMEAVYKKPAAKERMNKIKSDHKQPQVMKDLVEAVTGKEAVLASKDTTKYKQCKIPGSVNIPFDRKNGSHRYDAVVKDYYEIALERMDQFVESHIDPDEKENLLKNLLEILFEDEQIGETEEFYISESGVPLTKSDIIGEAHYDLSSFLVGVLHYCLTVRSDDNCLGAATFEAISADGGNRKARVLSDEFGRKFAGKIEVYLPEDRDVYRIGDIPDDNKVESETGFWAKTTESVADPIVGNSFIDIPLRNELFVGREKEMKKIEENFHSGKSIQIIYGMGGFGKTQLAIEYANKHKKDYRTILFIDSMPPEDIYRKYSAYLSNRHCLPQQNDQDSVCASFKNIMNNSGGWLIIYDNCDYDDKQFNEFIRLLPSTESGGNILITTRYDRPIGKAPRLLMTELSDEEACSFLCNRAGLEDREEAASLCHYLGNYPLALELAGAYIQATPGMTYSLYTERLLKNVSALDRAIGPAEYERTISGIIRITLDRIKTDRNEDKLSLLLEPILTICSLLPHYEIDVDILRFLVSSSLSEPANDYAKVFYNTLDHDNTLQQIATVFRDDLDADEFRRIVLKYSLMRNDNYGCLTMHPLQQEIIRSFTDKQCRIKYALGLTAAVMSQTYDIKYEKDGKWLHRPDYTMLYMHIRPFWINAVGKISKQGLINYNEVECWYESCFSVCEICKEVNSASSLMELCHNLRLYWKEFAYCKNLCSNEEEWQAFCNDRMLYSIGQANRLSPDIGWLNPMDGLEKLNVEDVLNLKFAFFNMLSSAAVPNEALIPLPDNLEIPSCLNISKFDDPDYFEIGNFSFLCDDDDGLWSDEYPVGKKYVFKQKDGVTLTLKVTNCQWNDHGWLELEGIGTLSDYLFDKERFMQVVALENRQLMTINMMNREESFTREERKHICKIPRWKPFFDYLRERSEKIDMIIADLISGIYPDFAPKIQALKDKGYGSQDNQASNKSREISNKDISRSFHVPPVTPWFSGRKYEIIEIKNLFAKGNKLIFVTAPGGYGKTQLARKFVEEYSSEFLNIFWINEANDISRIVDQYADYLVENNINRTGLGREGICSQFRKLVFEKENCLVVYDNVNCIDNDVFNEFRAVLPLGFDNVYILITSRNYRQFPDSCELKLSTLVNDKEAAKEFLIKRSNENDAETAALLVERLGYHPLAIEIAAAYILNTPWFSMRNYYEMVERSTDILKRAPEITDYSETLHGVVRNSFDSIFADNAENPVACYAESFLYLCAFSSPHHIMPEALLHISSRNSLDIVERYLSDEDKNALEEVLNQQKKMEMNCKDKLDLYEMLVLLSRYGLLTLHDDDSLEMHELVQEIIRDFLGPWKVQWAFGMLCVYDKFAAYSHSDEIPFDIWSMMLLNVSSGLRIIAELSRKIGEPLFVQEADHIELLSHQYTVMQALYTMNDMQLKGCSRDMIEHQYKDMMYKFILMYKTFFVREVSKPQEIEYDILVNLLFIIRHIMLRISFLNRFDDGLLMLHYVVNAIEKEASIMGWENIQRVIFSEMNSDINSQDEFEFQHPDNERSVIERIESLVYTVMVGYLKKNYSRDENTIQIVKRFFDMVDKYKPMDEGDKDLQVLKDMRVLRKAFYANDRTKIPERFRDLVVYPSEHKKNETAEDN